MHRHKPVRDDPPYGAESEATVAKYDSDKYAPAGAAWIAEHPEAHDSETDAPLFEALKAEAARIAASLTSAHAAHAGLDSVSRLRPSIARRFVRLTVAPMRAEAAAILAARKADQSAKRAAKRAAKVAA